jgi:hypothetical protein
MNTRNLRATRGITLIELLFVFLVMFSPFYLFFCTRKAYAILSNGHIIRWAHHGQLFFMFLCIFGVSALVLGISEKLEKRKPSSFLVSIAGLAFIALLTSFILLSINLITLLGDGFAFIAFNYFRFV